MSEVQDWRVTYERGLVKEQQEFSVGQFALYELKTEKPKQLDQSLN